MVETLLIGMKFVVPKAGKESTSCILNICLAYFGVNIHRDIILADNSHPFLSQTISCEGRQCSTYHYLDCHWTGGLCIL